MIRIKRIGLGLFVATLVAFSSSMPANAGGPVRLTSDGDPVAVVVLPDGAGVRSAERGAADLLVRHVRQMSGAELQVVHEAALQGRVENGRVATEADDLPAGTETFVLLGEGELAAALGVTPEGLGVGGMRVQSVGNALVLLGGPTEAPGHTDTGGVRHAVLEVLEHLGCRYLWPGELGKVVPERATVEVAPLDVAYTPQIGRRGIRWRWGGTLRGRSLSGFERLGLELEQRQEAIERARGEVDPISWSAWHRLGGRMRTFGHAGAGLRNGLDYLETHPEWFALQGDGTRDQDGDSRFRLCKSNPELIEHVANDIIQRAKENPDLTLVSLDPNDGSSRTGWCICENCMALDPPEAPPRNMTVYRDRPRPGARRRRTTLEHVSRSDRMVFYWNSIAEKVAEVHPDLRFGISVYSAWTHPPVQRTLHPNLVARYVPATPEHLDGWREAGLRHVFWRPNILLANRRHGKLVSIVGRLADSMHTFARAGISQTDFDSIGNHWATLGLSYYAAARLNWNPEMTAQEIMEDYAVHGFGGGAEHILRYFERVEEITAEGVRGAFSAEEDWRYTPEVVAELRGLLNAAEEAADDPTISERIAFLRIGLNFTELQEKLSVLAWRAREGVEVDRDLAQKVVDLNCLALRDILLHHNLASNTAHLVWATSTFARYSPIRGRTVTPSDPALLERIGDPDYGWTGSEDSMEEMLAAFGLD